MTVMNRTDRSLDTVLHGDCVSLMSGLDGRERRFHPHGPAISRELPSTAPAVAIINDDNDAWLAPAFAEMFRASQRSNILRQLLRLE